MTMVRDMELVQLLEDAKQYVKDTRVDPEDYDFGPAYESDRRAREHLLARLETEIRRRSTLR